MPSVQFLCFHVMLLGFGFRTQFYVSQPNKPPLSTDLGSLTRRSLADGCCLTALSSFTQAHDKTGKQYRINNKYTGWAKKVTPKDILLIFQQTVKSFK